MLSHRPKLHTYSDTFKSKHLPRPTATVGTSSKKGMTSLDLLKNVLILDPVFALLYLAGHVTLNTDACDVQIGCILLQQKLDDTQTSWVLVEIPIGQKAKVKYDAKIMSRNSIVSISLNLLPRTTRLIICNATRRNCFSNSLVSRVDQKDSACNSSTSNLMLSTNWE